MALVLLPHVGRRCTPRLSRALGLPGARQVPAVFTTPSWTRGASRTATASPSRATMPTWTSRGEADGREVHAQGRGALGQRPVGLAGSKAAEPHH
eukprot:12329495-Alexandrium_andersonii.AAC.1